MRRWSAQILLAGLLCITGLALAPIVAEAILVAPHALFMTHDQRTGEVYLANQSDRAEEVAVELRFGYPATDSAGNIGIHWVDDPGPEHQSAAEWLRVFPRRALVEPGQRQRVRVHATPPANLPDGEYWTRMIVSSRVPTEPIAVTRETEVVAGVTMVLRTITSITYRQGTVHTDIRLDDFRASVVRDSLEVWVALTRGGNAAYLGRVTMQLRDTRDAVVRQWHVPVAVYYSVNRRLAFPLDAVNPGRYRVRLLVETERDDIDVRHVLPAAPIERTLELEID